jgi:protein-S-isoprenylcysteine O-methyltransferase Ste14
MSRGLPVQGTTPYFAVLTVLLIMSMVLTRVFIMKRNGVEALHFGKIDKTDYFIPPFALFYFYLILAAAFGWPAPSGEFFDSHAVGWIGVALCLAGLTLLAWSLVSFGQSFRVGIDMDRPDKLITTGIFAFTRNPIYVGFALILLGQFLIYSSWLLLAYLVAGYWLFHRQVLREEELAQH